MGTGLRRSSGIRSLGRRTARSSSKASSTTSRQSALSRVRGPSFFPATLRVFLLIHVSPRRSPPEFLLFGPTAEYRLRPAAVCATRLGHRGTHVVLSARADADGFPRTESALECERPENRHTSRSYQLTIRAPSISRRNCLPSQATRTTTNSRSSSTRSPKSNRPRSCRNSCRRTTISTGRETTRARRARSR